MEGVQGNVIPPQLCVTFDMRLGINVDHEQFEKQLNNWCDEAGGNIEIVYDFKHPYVPPTKIDDSNKYYVALKKAIEDL